MGGSKHSATFLTIKLSSSVPKRSDWMGQRLCLLRFRVMGQQQEAGKQPRLVHEQRQPDSEYAHVPSYAMLRIVLGRAWRWMPTQSRPYPPRAGCQINGCKRQVAKKKMPLRMLLQDSKVVTETNCHFCLLCLHERMLIF